MVEHGAETLAADDGDGLAGEPEDGSLDPARGEEAEEPAAFFVGVAKWFSDAMGESFGKRREVRKTRTCKRESQSVESRNKAHLVTTPTQPFPAARPTAPSPSGRPTTQSLSLALPNVSNLW